MKTLILVAALMQPAAPPAALPQAPLYSFNDVYDLTVGGAAMSGFPAAAGPVRVAVTPPPAEAGFSIHAVPLPERTLLIISGLAAAFWVARRRLGYAL